jgi:hypothetical protein
MKPHPRIRKTIKWGGAAVTALLVMVWIWSAWWHGFLWNSGRHWLDVSLGRVTIAFQTWPHPPEDGAGFTTLNPAMTGWRNLVQAPVPTWETNGLGPNGWAISLPLSLPTFAFIVVSALACRFDALARRRERAARLNLCPKCNYDRAGIAADAKCPECGSAAA